MSDEARASDPELSRACEVVAQKDVQPLRRALFERLSSRLPALRLARATWQRLGTGRRAAAFVSLLSLKSYLEVHFPEGDADLLAVWKYDNERRQFEALQALDPSLRIASIELESFIRPAAVQLPRSELAAGWELIRAYASRGEFLIAARVAETVGYYFAMLRRLAEHPAPAVLVSSDTNPYAVALVHAARRVGKKTCFVTHGHVAEGARPLDFDLSLLDGQAVRDVYQRAGAIRGAVVFKGSEGVVRAMSTGPLARGAKTLGVVLPILVDWDGVGALLRRLRDELDPERIVLRLHPNRTMREPRWEQNLSLERVRVSLAEASLIEDIAACDLVVAGNTSAHLGVLKYGIPTVYAPRIDEMADDYYGFVRDHIVCPANGPIDLDAVRRFYDDPDWVRRFSRFDSGYPDHQAACDRDVVQALRALVSREPSS